MQGIKNVFRIRRDSKFRVLSRYSFQETSNAKLFVNRKSSEAFASCSKEDIGEIEDERVWRCGDCWTTVRSEGGKAELARPPPSVSGYRDNWPWMCRVQRRSRRRPSTIRPVSFHVRYSRRKTRSALGSASCTILIREFAEEEILNYERKV